MCFNELVHYEIQGRKGASWTIINVFDNRSVATKQAEKLWGAGKRYTGLRVLKESYNKSSHEFKSVEIFSRGATGKKSKYDQTGEITPCLTPDDLYSPDGRRSIWLLMRNTLTDWRIIPTELLHNLEHFNKLNNTGTLLQDAIQRTAVAFEVENDSIQERMRNLYKVVDICVDLIKAAQKSIPKLELGRLKPIITTLEKAPNKRFLLTCSLVEYLRPAITPNDKFGRISIFLSNTRPNWVTKILDQLMAELLLHKNVINEVLGEYQDRSIFLCDLAYLSTGNLDQVNQEEWQQKYSDDAQRLNGFLKQGILPLTSHALQERLKQEISSSEPISSDGLIEQLKSLRNLKTIIYNLLDNPYQLDEIRGELNARSARLINSQSISDLLAEHTGPIEQLNAVLDVEAAAIGRSNKLTIANYIMPILTRPEYESIFMGLDGMPLKRMESLVHLQKKVLKAELTEMHRRQIAETLDDFCKVIMDNTQLLKKLHGLNISLQDKSEKILNMMVEGYFTDGDCFNRAEHQVRTYMKQDGFTSGLIQGLSREQAEQKLISFKQLLIQAGIDKPNPDDEEALAATTP